MKTELVAATGKDFTAILEMMAEFNTIDHYPFNRDQASENLAHFVADPNLGRVWTIHVDDVIAGYAVLTFGFSFEHNGRDAFIDELFLKAAYRQKGIGNVVMDILENAASALGVNVLHLEVEQHNERGITLYKGKGYNNNGRMLLSKKILKGTEE